jgi:dihydroorotate dehydrogenase (NAD+) catalytic subunit
VVVRERMTRVDLAVELCGLALKTPLIPASGTLAKEALGEVEGVYGAMLPKTTTPRARVGNPPPRVAETPAGMVNSIGLQNPGIEAFLRDLDAFDLGVPLIVSVAGDTVAEFGSLCERLAADERVTAIELNLSCPNVEEAPETAAELVAASRAATGKPLYAKLSPATSDIADSARAVEAAGADGLSLVNTVRGLALDPQTLLPRLARGSGGLSGPALRPLALHCVQACAGAVELPIVGMGGVASGRDALELVAAGASAVALGTVLFGDPLAPTRIRSEVVAELGARGLASALQIRGTVRESARFLTS